MWPLPEGAKRRGLVAFEMAFCSDTRSSGMIVASAGTVLRHPVDGGRGSPSLHRLTQKDKAVAPFRRLPIQTALHSPARYQPKRRHGKPCELRGKISRGSPSSALTVRVSQRSSSPKGGRPITGQVARNSTAQAARWPEFVPGWECCSYFPLARPDVGMVDPPLHINVSSVSPRLYAVPIWYRFLRNPDDNMIDTNAISRELLLDALAREAITPAFQCLVDFRDYGVKGFEVLARWVEPGIGEIPPVRFIPAMEQHGLMDALLIHMLSKACQIAVTWEGDFALPSIYRHFSCEILPCLA